MARMSRFSMFAFSVFVVLVGLPILLSGVSFGESQLSAENAPAKKPRPKKKKSRHPNVKKSHLVPLLDQQWKRIKLDSEFRSEGVAVADINKDGKLDVVAGAVWYEAPHWKMHTIRKVPKFNGATGYSESFSQHAYDVNGDGWVDIVNVGYPRRPAHWYENPKNQPGDWKAHVLHNSVANESPSFLDLDGDGKPELLHGSGKELKMGVSLLPGKKDDPTKPWKFRPFSRLKPPRFSGFQHGLGTGDLNGDGRNDVIVTDGWWEQPVKITDKEWLFHPVIFGAKDSKTSYSAAHIHTDDLDLDGDNDVIMSSAHGYGIWWFENVDGKQSEQFKHHIIDEAYSQTHSMCFADLNGDGQKEIITGKRYFAHKGRDPGGKEPVVMYWYEIKKQKGKPPVFVPHEIVAGRDVGIGTQFEVIDINGDKRPDIVIANKKGVNILLQTAPVKKTAAKKTAATKSAPPKQQRPNILFIFTDDHASHAMSCYGSKINKTPNLDRIAREGMRFDNCFCTNSLCGPSRAVIQTGKHNHLNGFKLNGDKFDGTQQTFPKLMQKAGYETAIIGKWHLATTPTGFHYHEVLPGQGAYYNPDMIHNGKKVKHTGYTTNIITDLTMKWLSKKRDKNKPFMLMCQQKAPHRSWFPGPKYLTRYDNVTLPEPSTLFDDYKGRGTAARQQNMTIKETLTPYDLKFKKPNGLNAEQLKKWNAAYGPKNAAFRQQKLKGKALISWKYQRYMKDYLRCIDAVDDNVGRLLKYLDDTGLAKNTIVIYSSDQGFYLGDHGWFDKRFMYEESFRMPLVARWPGVIKPGTVCKDLVSNLDFAETFLDVAKVKIPADMQGVSLLPVMKGKTPKDWRKSVYYHYYEFLNNAPVPHNVRRHYGVRTNRYKLIHFYNLDEWELYDLKTDPQEMKSAYGKPAYAAITKRLKTELTRLQKQYKVPDDRGSVKKNPPILKWTAEERLDWYRNKYGAEHFPPKKKDKKKKDKAKSKG